MRFYDLTDRGIYIGDVLLDDVANATGDSWADPPWVDDVANSTRDPWTDPPWEGLEEGAESGGEAPVDVTASLGLNATQLDTLKLLQLDIAGVRSVGKE